jgi:putative hydrolase of HD superfamily
METVRSILTTLQLAERLKRELRHSWLSNGRQESVAEHTYQMALMAVLVAPYLESAVNLERTLKLVILHDLVEAIAGDVPFFEVSDRRNEKSKREQEAIENIRSGLPKEIGSEVFELWHEFEDGITTEAKLARALDNLEVQLQHNFADMSTWEPIEHELVYTKMDPHCEHDSFLRQLCGAIKSDAEEKLRMHGVLVDVVKERIVSKRTD